jgi:hypothetical protein
MVEVIAASRAVQMVAMKVVYWVDLKVEMLAEPWVASKAEKKVGLTAVSTVAKSEGWKVEKRVDEMVAAKVANLAEKKVVRTV